MHAASSEVAQLALWAAARRLDPVETVAPEPHPSLQMAGTSNAYRAGVEEYDGQGGNWTCTRWY